MTRGKILLVNDGKVYITTEFNGDMYPSGYGNDIIAAFKRNRFDTVEHFYEFVGSFNRRNFGYSEEIIRIKEISELDINQNWTDYLYVINLTNKDFIIITKDKEIILPANALGICHFQEYLETIKKPVQPKPQYLSKDDFEFYILALKSDVHFYTAVTDVCREYGRQDTIDIYPVTMINFVDLLKLLMHDENDYIFKWCYDCDFGSTELTTSNGETIETIDDLYAILTTNRKVE